MENSHKKSSWMRNNAGYLSDKISELSKNRQAKKIIFALVAIIGLFHISSLWFIMAISAIAEAVSCYIFRRIFVKGWLEILSFATIVIAIKFGFRTAFFYYLGAYAVSMASRMTIYPVEPPFILSNALILSYLPTVFPDGNLFIVTLVSMVIKRIALFPILAFFGLPLIRNINDSVLNVIFSTLMVTYFGDILLRIL